MDTDLKNDIQEELSPGQMLDELEEAFPQFQESFNRLKELYNRMILIRESLNDMQKELDMYRDQTGICKDCGGVFRKEDLSRFDLCPQHHFEMNDRHGDYVEEIEFEEVEEDRPY